MRNMSATTLVPTDQSHRRVFFRFFPRPVLLASVDNVNRHGLPSADCRATPLVPSFTRPCSGHWEACSSTVLCAPFERYLFFRRRNWTGSEHSRNVKCNEKRHYEWSSSDAPHWRADARRAGARRRSTHARRRAKGWRAHPNIEAEEAGQVHVKLQKKTSTNQEVSLVSVHVRPC